MTKNIAILNSIIFLFAILCMSSCIKTKCYDCEYYYGYDYEHEYACEYDCTYDYDSEYEYVYVYEYAYADDG